MPGKVVILIVVVLLCSLSHSGNTGVPEEDVLAIYRRAERLFSLKDPTDRTDSIALSLYRQIIQHLEKKPVDSILFQCWLKTGVLLDVRSEFSAAKNAYLRAIQIRRARSTHYDSTLYQPYVYAGTAYYHLNNFDSADHYLLEAEKIGTRFPGVKEQDRLYNALGALYYENGNYVQSRNYFMRALAIIKKNNPADFETAMHFEINIAASFYKLGLYNESLSLYHKLLKNRLYTSPIYINMGKAYGAMAKYAEAMTCYRKVDPKEEPGVYNEMANVQLQLNRLDSAGYFLDRFFSFPAKDLTRVNKLDEGINYMYRSDWLNRQKKYLPALEALQKAIILFSGNFHNEDIYSNPSEFAGTFASYKLFDALYRKAMTFQWLYGSAQTELYLQAAHTTYQQTISLLRYIEKSYDSDDAKIFLKKNSQSAYRGAFAVCMQMHRLHPRGNYLEQAFLVTEKNRASVIAARLTENRLKKIRGIDSTLLQQERNIKYNIARLIIRSELEQDPQAQQQITRNKQLYEIELSRLQKKIEQNSSYYQLKYADSFPTVEQIRGHISSNQVVISFYSTDTALYIFAIARNYFRQALIDSMPLLKQRVEHWITDLAATGTGRKFNAGQTGRHLYEQLVQPVQALVGSSEEWIIIPDDILHYLPFESLPAGMEGELLLEKAVISYHFSSRFLNPNSTGTGKRRPYSILSFAPFSTRAFLPMSRLPASAAEIAALPGKQYLDSLATKKYFLENIDQYPIVHLATHAVADLSNPSRSYIAFYPGGGSAEEDNLYLDELYGLNLDATELVIISACETGTGKLVGSEGLFSLSRGFSYAGSASVINSLWKADDAATAAILKQFHRYLQEGYSKAKALQQAKLDYIHVHSLHKTPDYWAHLIIVGNTRPVMEKNSPGYGWWLAGALVVVLVTIAAGSRRWRKKKEVDAVFPGPES